LTTFAYDAFAFGLAVPDCVRAGVCVGQDLAVDHVVPVLEVGGAFHGALLAPAAQGTRWELIILGNVGLVAHLPVGQMLLLFRIVPGLLLPGL
jgi:hypothetical protein